MLPTDFRLALRRLLGEPRYSGVVIAMLAIGIGATTATFSLLDAVVLQPLPYREPDALLAIVSIQRARGIEDGNVSMGDYVAWRSRARSFDGIAATGYAELVLTGRGEPERVAAAAVSANFLRVLGGRPILGRDFLPQEETPGRDQVVLLSHGLWRRRFGADPAVVGRSINLSGYTYQIVGVMPADFHFHRLDVGFLSPMSLDMRNLMRQRRGIAVFARLRRGVSLAQARQEMGRVADELAQEYPAVDAGWSVRLTPLRDETAAGSRASLVLLFGASLMVLGLTVANVANLMIARLLSRGHETMIRMAAGARWSHLLRPHLVESLLLSLIGGGGGVILAGGAVRLLRTSPHLQIPRLGEANVGQAATTLAFAVALGAALVLTALPVLQGVVAAARSWTSEVRGGSRKNGRRIAETITVVELSLALILLVGAGLLARSLQMVARIDPGFEARNVAVMNLNLPLSRYPDARRQGAFLAQLLERLRGLPGVATAAESSDVPLNSARLNVDAAIARAGAQGGGRREDRAAVRLISSDYFRTLRIPLLTGRDLTERDGPGMPVVALVNEALASRIWPAEPPLGKRLRLAYGGEQTYEVVGVVGNVRQRGPESGVSPEVFLPYRQHPAPFASLVVRTRNEPEAAVPAFKAALWNLDPEQDMTVSTLEKLVDASLFPRRFLTDLVAVFTAIAVAVAMLGVFSMSSQAAQQRTRELGIRIALGARVGDVVRQMLARNLGLTAIGLGIGLAGAFLSSRFLASFLFGVQAFDPLAVTAAAAILVATAMGGSYLPVRRAAGGDPMTALRRD